ncbi:collagen alpha-1(III) chain-like [Asterias rubens]|uniref:collagen alpha-1(III) chain-like n=1 Tax=Asterias rubens TaxID=7604 RepID=UPI0014558FCB|nr:collagen alpha-1(III) chain-like [Asterias rubens]
MQNSVPRMPGMGPSDKELNDLLDFSAMFSPPTGAGGKPGGANNGASMGQAGPGGPGGPARPGGPGGPARPPGPPGPPGPLRSGPPGIPPTSSGSAGHTTSYKPGEILPLIIVHVVLWSYSVMSSHACNIVLFLFFL